MTVYCFDILLLLLGTSLLFHIILTVASWSADGFLKRQVRWSGIPISFRISHGLHVIHTGKGFGIVNKAEIDVFLELSCFFPPPLFYFIF